jgi:hypothetical protein
MCEETSSNGPVKQKDADFMATTARRVYSQHSKLGFPAFHCQQPHSIAKDAAFTKASSPPKSSVLVPSSRPRTHESGSISAAGHLRYQCASNTIGQLANRDDAPKGTRTSITSTNGSWLPLGGASVRNDSPHKYCRSDVRSRCQPQHASSTIHIRTLRVPGLTVFNRVE